MKDLFSGERLLGNTPYITDTAYDVLDLMSASYMDLPFMTISVPMFYVFTLYWSNIMLYEIMCNVIYPFHQATQYFSQSWHGWIVLQYLFSRCCFVLNIFLQQLFALFGKKCLVLAEQEPHICAL
jgi:hypothetical protein